MVRDIDASDVRAIVDNRRLPDGGGSDQGTDSADRARDSGSDRALTVRPRAGRLIPAQGTSLLDCPTSLDLSTPHGEALAFKATSPGDLDLDLFNKGEVVIEASDYLCFPDERVDEETGEISQFTRSVLYGVTGSVLRLSGTHIPHKIAALCDLYGWPRWRCPVKLLVKTRKGRRGRDWHDIQILP